MTHHSSTVARRLTAIACGVLALLLQNSAHATTATPYFTNLVSELQARSTALTGTTNKLAKIQKKAIDGALKSITTARGISLVDDLKLASMVTKGLAKSFTAEFAPGGAATPPGQQSFGGLSSALVSNLATEVTADLADLDAQISALADGPKKVVAFKLADALRQKLTSALGLTPIATEASALAIVETGIISLAKTVLKAANSGSSGGGGGVGGRGLTCKINGVAFTALGAAGVYVSQTGELAIAGATAQKAVTIIAFTVTGTGEYPAIASFVQELTTGVTYASNVTGTIHIATFNLAQQKASGTFAFTASQTTPTPNPTNTVTVTQGTFNITTIVSAPN